MHLRAIEYIETDLFRYFGAKSTSIKQKVLLPLEVKYIIRLRKASFAKNKFLKLYHKYRLRSLTRRTMIQISSETKIGKGLYIGHCGRIIINPKTVLGNNVNLSTGVVIGKTNRGDREGTPRIGDNVWIGANAVIVGKVNIGNDVLIAPNSYVNFDIPSHSIVIGNPAKVYPKVDATKGYINNPYE